MGRRWVSARTAQDCWGTRDNGGFRYRPCRTAGGPGTAVSSALRSAGPRLHPRAIPARQVGFSSRLSWSVASRILYLLFLLGFPFCLKNTTPPLLKGLPSGAPGCGGPVRGATGCRGLVPLSPWTPPNGRMVSFRASQPGEGGSCVCCSTAPWQFWERQKPVATVPRAQLPAVTRKQRSIRT